MTKEQILNEVNNSSWEVEFEFTDDINLAVDSILRRHEDYFLKLNSKVKEVIEKGIDYVFCSHNFNTKKEIAKADKELSNHLKTTNQITFADACNWQKEVFEYKKKKISDYVKPPAEFDDENDTTQSYKDAAFRYSRCKNLIRTLPNQHIDLGLRKTNVIVGNWTPPSPIFLNDLIEMCFPLSMDMFIELNENEVKEKLLHWYKVFQTIHFFEDLNGRVGGIVVNILSYVLTGKYLIVNQ